MFRFKWIHSIYNCSVIIECNNWIKYNFYFKRNLGNGSCDWQKICWISKTNTNINEKIWNIICCWFVNNSYKVIFCKNQHKYMARVYYCQKRLLNTFECITTNNCEFFCELFLIWWRTLTNNTNSNVKQNKNYPNEHVEKEINIKIMEKQRKIQQDWDTHSKVKRYRDEQQQENERVKMIVDESNECTHKPPVAFLFRFWLLQNITIIYGVVSSIDLCFRRYRNSSASKSIEYIWE